MQHRVGLALSALVTIDVLRQRRLDQPLTARHSEVITIPRSSPNLHLSSKSGPSQAQERQSGPFACMERIIPSTPRLYPSSPRLPFCPVSKASIEPSDAATPYLHHPSSPDFEGEKEKNACHSPPGPPSVRHCCNALLTYDTISADDRPTLRLLSRAATAAAAGDGRICTEPSFVLSHFSALCITWHDVRCAVVAYLFFVSPIIPIPCFSTGDRGNTSGEGHRGRLSAARTPSQTLPDVVKGSAIAHCISLTDVKNR